VSLPERVALIDKLRSQVALSSTTTLPDDGCAVNTKGVAAFGITPSNLAVFCTSYLVN